MITIEEIQTIVSSYFDITIFEMTRIIRKREIVQARQISMYFCKKYTKKSLALIGELHGGKDHATVMHANKTILNLIDVDKQIRKYCSEISAKIIKYQNQKNAAIVKPFCERENINGILLN